MAKCCDQVVKVIITYETTAVKCSTYNNAAVHNSLKTSYIIIKTTNKNVFFPADYFYFENTVHILIIIISIFYLHKVWNLVFGIYLVGYFIVVLIATTTTYYI